MYTLDDGIDLYENAIEQAFLEYFENRGIDLSGEGYKRVEMNLYHAAFGYVYKKLFKPDENTRRKYGRKSKLDYDDAIALEEVIDTYGNIVKAYNIKATQDMFCDMVGISRDTLHSWRSGNTRAYVYYDNNNNIIRDIQEYKLNNRGEYRRELGSSHSDLAEKVKRLSEITAYNGLNDTPVGQITHANNASEAGMEYNRKREVERIESAHIRSSSELLEDMRKLQGNAIEIRETQ